MKFLISLLIYACATSNVLGQGGVHFNNRAVVGLDAPVTLLDGKGPGPAMNAGLYLVENGGGLELLRITTFHTSSPGQDPRAAMTLKTVEVTVPGVPAGASASFRVRVWDAKFPSYEAAVLSNACCGEFQTTNRNGEVHVPKLGDLNPPGSSDIFLPHLVGLLPLQVPCFRSSTNANVLVPSVKLTPRGLGPNDPRIRLEVSTSFPGQSTIIEASEDLVLWSPIHTNPVGSTTFELIVDPRESGRPAKWYRARVQIQ